MLVAGCCLVGSEWTIGLLLKGVNSFFSLVKLFGLNRIVLFMHRSCMDCLWVDKEDWVLGRKLEEIGGN